MHSHITTTAALTTGHHNLIHTLQDSRVTLANTATFTHPCSVCSHTLPPRFHSHFATTAVHLHDCQHCHIHASLQCLLSHFATTFSLTLCHHVFTHTLPPRFHSHFVTTVSLTLCHHVFTHTLPPLLHLHDCQHRLIHASLQCLLSHFATTFSLALCTTFSLTLCHHGCIGTIANTASFTHPCNVCSHTLPPRFHSHQLHSIWRVQLKPHD